MMLFVGLVVRVSRGASKFTVRNRVRSYRMEPMRAPIDDCGAKVAVSSRHQAAWVELMVGA
jgi:hypothetical protein